MKRLLYIGNNLRVKSSNITSIQLLGSLLEVEGYTLFYASSKVNQVWRFLDMIWSCWKYRNKVDTVLIDTYSTNNFYYALGVSQYCRMVGMPYIAILHGGNLETRLINNPKFSKLIFNNAHSLISPSLFLKDIFTQYSYETVKFIPNALSLNSYDFKNRELDSIKLLWVRSFSKIYNPLLAIKVLKRLQLEGYKASLCMIGPDSDGTLGHAQALAKELKVEVEFTGKLSKTQWHNLSKDYNVFINTSNLDNMPVSVIEAMALGLPVISTNVGGMAYLIEHEKEGLLVSPNDEFEMANAVKRIKNQHVFTKSMTFNARKKVEKYDWDLVKIKWFEVLS